MRLDELAHEFNLFRISDAQKNQRRVAGNTIGPKRALTPTILEQNARGRATGGVGINDRPSQSGIKLRFGFGGVEMAQDHLTVGPSQIARAVGHAEMLIFFY